jgi:hypothetical protein
VALLFQRFAVVQVFVAGARVFVSGGGLSPWVAGFVIFLSAGLSIFSSVASSRIVGLGVGLVFNRLNFGHGFEHILHESVLGVCGSLSGLEQGHDFL